MAQMQPYMGYVATWLSGFVAKWFFYSSTYHLPLNIPAPTPAPAPLEPFLPALVCPAVFQSLNPELSAADCWEKTPELLEDSYE